MSKTRTVLVLGLLAFLSAEGGLTDVVGYPELSIRERFDRATLVAEARVLEIKRLGVIDPNRPMGPCGILVKIRVLEQFRGQPLPETSGFGTHQVLFPDKPLVVGDMVLVLLRDIQEPFVAKGAVDPTIVAQYQKELKDAYASILACAPEAPSLYLSIAEDGVFPIVSKRGELWVEQRGGRTRMPENIRARESNCGTTKNGACTITEYPAVAWFPLREVLRSWRP